MPMADMNTDSNDVGHRINPYQAAVNVANDVAQANWSQKTWVWIPDKSQLYVAASIKDTRGESYLVALETGEEREVKIEETEKCNPPKFDKVEDMADLTYLNEPSVLHNLKLRYYSNMIYTYSGLFLVAINPYRSLPIYSEKQIQAYKSKKRKDVPPHIFAVADNAFQDLIANRENQSILITGESGAGKTENTKRVIQYLAAIAADRAHGNEQHNLEAKVLQANPLLESFGNAQTGKFIRIEFNNSGNIAGANIERYLLEKSRVTHQTSKERNFHVFYQLMAGADKELKNKLLLDGSLSDYQFTKNSNKTIPDVDDASDFNALLDSMQIMEFKELEIFDILRVVATLLHLGNVKPVPGRDDQAELVDTAAAERACHLMGIPLGAFVKAILKPQIKAGRETVTQHRTCEQVVYSIEALSRATYERLFSWLIERVNLALDRPSPKNKFIGVLDIAGFEIFQVNSFEQLLINYTNEKLQQFFNHHMFVLEQEEYRRENIEWRFIDFGLDLQPTIDLIEKANPVGVLSCLDEECVFPQATDRTFTDKLNSIWKGKSAKYETPRLPGHSFVLQHYAAKVEYSTAGWLDKNKDPLNESVTALLSASTEPFMSSLFADCIADLEEIQTVKRSIVKKGVFRTVAQRHKEQLGTLMARLNETQPHFVRCILPNETKKAGQLDSALVLDQLRCNGVLEGIRICRAGFPNRLPFADFRARYEVLSPKVIPPGFIDGRQAAEKLLDSLSLTANQYRLGSSKVFFRAGVLAELEERRDHQLSAVFTRVQARWRGYIARKRYTRKVLQLRAARVIQKNARVYVQLREWMWWRLYAKVKPLLSVTRVDNELQRREDEIKYLNDNCRRMEEEVAKLKVLRSSLETERRQLEDVISEERRASADQAEILQRTQEKVIELDALLVEAMTDVKTKQDQSEHLIEQHSELERQLEYARKSLADAETVMERMDRDRLLREEELRNVENDLRSAKDRVEQLQAGQKSLEEQLQILQDNLAESLARERELTSQRAAFAISLQEVADKVAAEISLKDAAERRISILEQSLKEGQASLEDALCNVEKLEQVVAHQEREVTRLSESLDFETNAKNSLEMQRRELQLRLESLESEVTTEQSEREKLIASKKRLEQELDQLHTMMLEKGDSVAKQSQLRELREQELADAKHQLQDLQQTLDETRRSLSGQIQGLRLELQQAVGEVTQLTQTKVTLEAKLVDVSRDLEAALEDGSRQLRKVRQVSAELQQAKGTVEELQAKLGEAFHAKTSHVTTISALSSKLEDLELLNANMGKEAASLTSTVAQLRSQNEELNEKLSIFEGSKNQLSLAVRELQGKLDDEELDKQELKRQLAMHSESLEKLRAASEIERKTKDAEMQDLRRRIELELDELRKQVSDLSASRAGLEKTRQKLTSELEDLRHENERLENAARQSEKVAKGLEHQVQQAASAAEAEHRQREIAEMEARKLQSAVDNLRVELEAKNNAYAGLQRQKNELETELRGLIEEIGEGGRNVHDLERNLRRATARIDELSLQLEEEDATKAKLLELNASIEASFSEYRQKAEANAAEKEGQMEETRRILLKEINELGEQLDSLNEANLELVKSKRKLQAELDDYLGREDVSAKSRSELEKAKKASESALRDLQTRLEAEQRSRRDFEDLAKRQEQKANTLQSDVEQLRVQVEASERERRNLQKQLDVVTDDLEGSGDTSRKSLLIAKRKWEIERQSLLEQIDVATDTIRSLEMEKEETAAIDAHEQKKRTEAEYDARLEQVENEKRALLAAQRLLQQELEDKMSESLNFERQRKLMQGEIDDLRLRLDSETLARSDEAASRRKLTAELKETIEKCTTETTRAQEFAKSAEKYKLKATEALAQLEQVELAKLRVEKEAGLFRMQVKDLQDSLQDVTKEKRAIEEKCRSLEDQLQTAQDVADERETEISEARNSREKLRADLEALQARLTTETDQANRNVEDMRKKFQKDVRQLNEELANERSINATARNSTKQLELDVQRLQTRLEEERRTSDGWRRDKERFAQRLEEIAHAVSMGAEQQENVASLASAGIARLRAIDETNEKATTQKTSLDRIKKNLEQRVQDSTVHVQEATRVKQTLERSIAILEDESTSLRNEIEEQNDSISRTSQQYFATQGMLSSIESELIKERTTSVELSKTKTMLEKQVKDLHTRVAELEDASAVDATRNSAKWQAQLDLLSSQLADETREKSIIQKAIRDSERQLKALAFQLSERDKFGQRLKEEAEKREQLVQQLRLQLNDMEGTEANLAQARRKAEREAEESKDRAIRLEKELESLKSRLDLTGSGEQHSQSVDVA